MNPLPAGRECFPLLTFPKDLDYPTYLCLMIWWVGDGISFKLAFSDFWRYTLVHVFFTFYVLVFVSIAYFSALCFKSDLYFSLWFVSFWPCLRNSFPSQGNTLLHFFSHMVLNCVYMIRGRNPTWCFSMWCNQFFKYVVFFYYYYYLFLEVCFSISFEGTELGNLVLTLY